MIENVCAPLDSQDSYRDLSGIERWDTETRSDMAVDGDDDVFKSFATAKKVIMRRVIYSDELSRVAELSEYALLRYLNVSHKNCDNELTN